MTVNIEEKAVKESFGAADMLRFSKRSLNFVEIIGVIASNPTYNEAKTGNSLVFITINCQVRLKDGEILNTLISGTYSCRRPKDFLIENGIEKGVPVHVIGKLDGKSNVQENGERITMTTIIFNRISSLARIKRYKENIISVPLDDNRSYTTLPPELSKNVFHYCGNLIGVTEYPSAASKRMTLRGSVSVMSLETRPLIYKPSEIEIPEGSQAFVSRQNIFPVVFYTNQIDEPWDYPNNIEVSMEGFINNRKEVNEAKIARGHPKNYIVMSPTRIDMVERINHRSY